LVIRALNERVLLIQPRCSSAFNDVTNVVAGFNGNVAEDAEAQVLLLASSLSRPTGGRDSGGDGGRGFVCGRNLVCNPTTQYCSVFFGGPAGVPPNHGCTDLPDRCRSHRACDCVPSAGRGCKCTESGGGITVTCTAP